MTTPQLEALSDITSQAHAKIQQDFANINPVVGISTSMRNGGIPADAMTIDCLKTNHRIILVLHDNEPDIVRYQFAFRDKDPADVFEIIAFSDLTMEKLYDWMASYFSRENNL